MFCLFQVEGKGNGIKTVIVNMTEVAKSLQRPPTCKYTTTSNYLSHSENLATPYPLSRKFDANFNHKISKNHQPTIGTEPFAYTRLLCKITPNIERVKFVIVNSDDDN